VGIIIQLIVWLVGFYFVCNGVYMEYKITSAVQQQVSSIYMIGGCIIIALAIVIHRLGVISDDLRFAATKLTKGS